MMNCLKKGLTDTALKMIALVLMLLDHIHYIFGYTGLVPDWFSLLGRLSAPIFLFCLSEGFAHTRNRRKYFLTIYLMAAAMGALRFFMQWGGVLVRPDGFYPQNGMLSTFATLLVIWQGMDWLKNRKYVPGILAAALPLAWPVAASWLSGALQGVKGASTVIGLSAYTVLPAWGVNGSPDCGLTVIVTGMLMYALRGRRKLQVGVFMGVTFGYDFLYTGFLCAKYMPGFSWSMLLASGDWYGMFAGLLMLLYNGGRGAGFKKLFYVFYPAHIYILYALSWLMMTPAG